MVGSNPRELFEFIKFVKTSFPTAIEADLGVSMKAGTMAVAVVMEEEEEEEEEGEAEAEAN